ncbi:hypothetical protein L2E82_16368 [Cichorium intybus]|uniref:Uncharacterized protein n=1 Tax=Cichorium intybus TaxID=13427 RepID=A0ACB9F4U9_CICIN|nr:hypothetical protein L2E82_16368 [Cichorium intybus]
MMITKTFRTIPAVRGGPISQLRWSRLFAGKTPDRAAVHGLKQPPSYTLDDRKRMEEEIDKTNEEQGKRRKKVEEKVDSQLKNSENVVSESPESLSSS